MMKGLIARFNKGSVTGSGGHSTSAAAPAAAISTSPTPAKRSSVFGARKASSAKAPEEKARPVEEAADALEDHTTFTPPSNADDDKAVRALNLLRLDQGFSIDELMRVCEINPAIVNICDARGLSAEARKTASVQSLLGSDIAVLSWRWDLPKGPTTTVEESSEMRSPKIKAFLERAIADGFKFAWCDFCTVPQHSTDKELLMYHIRASRVLYETCSVLLVDLDELVPGVQVPSVDYMTRLWTTAEMSAMLVNRHVDYSDFVRVTKWNHATIAVVALNTEVKTLGMYVGSIKSLQSQGINENFWKYGLGKQSTLHSVVYGLGWAYTEKRWKSEALSPFLSTHLQVKLEDNSHATMEQPPLSTSEQEALIAEYEAKQRTHPAIDALLAEIGNQKQMTPSFSHTKHYPALLLMAYDVVKYHLMKERRWNKRCYEEILRSLKELPSANPNEESELRFGFAGDDAVVKRMIVTEHRVLPNPASVDGYDLVKVPAFHELSLTAKVIEGDSLDKALREQRVHLDESTTRVMFSFSNSEMTNQPGTKSTSLDIGSPHSRVTLAQVENAYMPPGTGFSLILTCNPEHGGQPRTLKGYTLAPGTCLLALSGSATRTEIPSPEEMAAGKAMLSLTRSVMLSRPAKVPSEAVLAKLYDAFKTWNETAPPAATDSEERCKERSAELVELATACGVELLPEPPSWKQS